MRVTAIARLFIASLVIVGANAVATATATATAAAAAAAAELRPDQAAFRELYKELV